MQQNQHPSSSNTRNKASLYNFIVKLSGSTKHSFDLASSDDQQKRFNYGLVVFIVVMASSIVASIAWSIPMGPAGLSVGLIWFPIMSGIEMLILYQMDTDAAHSLANAWLRNDFGQTVKKKWYTSFGWLLIRFIMIGGVSYFNSEMVRVLMFKPEIVAEIKVRQNTETAHISDSLSMAKKKIEKKIEKKQEAVTKADENLNTLITQYDEQIKAVEDSINYFNSKLVYEVKGPGGITGITGDGPVSKQIRETIKTYEKRKDQLITDRDLSKTESGQVNSLKLAQKEADSAVSRGKREMAELKLREKELIDQVMSRPVNGLAFMLEVLNDIAGRNPIIWAVFFLFFFIECIPVLMKFVSKNDSYIHKRALAHLENLKETQQEARDAMNQINAMNPQPPVSPGGPTHS